MLIVCALGLPSLAWSQESQFGSRPNEGGPTEVIIVNLALLDVVGISDRQQRFTVDAFVLIQWQDPRLAASAGDSADIRMMSADSIWTPRLAVLNNRGLDLLLPDVASVDRDGNVVLRQRLVGQLATDLDLHEFPFDSQELSIDVVSYQYPPDELTYSAESEFVANVDEFRSKGWTFELLDPEISIYRLTEDGVGTSQLSFKLRAERKSGYYVLTLALPMTLILFLAWLVHWLPPNVVPPRIGMASATVFSLIAFGVSFRLTLPAIEYLTRADRFVVLSTLLVAVSLAVTVLASRWATTEREDDANRLSLHMRVAFPIAYAAILMLTLVS